MATINVIIDDETKTAAESILKELGISASSAITMIYKEIIRERALPLKSDIYKESDYDFLNEETKSAVQEGRKIADDSNVKGYHDVEKMFEGILTR